MSRVRHDLLLAIARTDSSFSRIARNGEEFWSGKCIYCNTRLDLYADGRPLSAVTVEHLRPRNHGGTEDLQNLALSCPACNQSKGHRIDNRKKGDARMEEVIAAALERRRQRWRDTEGA